MNTPHSPTNGIVPMIFDHYAGLPLVYDFDGAKIEKINDRLSRQFLMGTQSMLVKWIYKKGAEIPLHFHPNEQITWITEGSVQIKSQGKTFIIKAGEVIIFPPYVPHEFVALEDTINIDFFCPVRGDWFATAADYLSKVKK